MCNILYNACKCNFGPLSLIISCEPDLHALSGNDLFSNIISTMVKNNANANGNGGLEKIEFRNLAMLQSFWRAIAMTTGAAGINSNNTNNTINNSEDVEDVEDVDDEDDDDDDDHRVTIKHLVLDRISEKNNYKVIQDNGILNKVGNALINLETLVWDSYYFKDDIQCFAPIVSRISRNVNSKLKEIKCTVSKDTFIDNKLEYGFNSVCQPLNNVLLEINSHSSQPNIGAINDDQINNLCNLLMTNDLTMNQLDIRKSRFTYGQTLSDHDTIVIKILKNINNRLAKNIDVTNTSNIDNDNYNCNLQKLTIDLDSLDLTEHKQFCDMINEICRLYNYHNNINNNNNLQLNFNLEYCTKVILRPNVDWLTHNDDDEKMFVGLFTMMQRVLTTNTYTCQSQMNEKKNDLKIEIIIRDNLSVPKEWIQQFISIIDKLNFQLELESPGMQQYHNIKHFDKIAIRINFKNYNHSICIAPKYQITSSAYDYL